MKKIFAILAVFLPLPLKLLVYRTVFKWKIGKGVKIGFSFIQANYVELGDGTHIGHFNVIRKVKKLVMGKECLLLNFNEIAGGWLQVGNASEVIFADKVLVMSHQYFDAIGTIKIGANTTIGGRDTHFWTHTRKTLEDGSPILVPLDITIGEDVYSGARVTFVGCDIPDGAMIGAGAVVVKSFPKEEERFLIAGNPATIKKRF